MKNTFTVGDKVRILLHDVQRTATITHIGQPDKGWAMATVSAGGEVAYLPLHVREL